jgi:6-phosphogluconolactonase
VPLLTNEMVKRKVHFKPFANQLFFLACDERFVPLDHVDSNFGEYIARNLFKELGVPTENLFPINYEGTVEQCARDYDRRLRPFLNKHNGFDILLVGAGPDGHTCRFMFIL